jgi:hypothetical protein
MASGDIADVIEILETSIAGPANSSTDHGHDNSVDGEREFIHSLFLFVQILFFSKIELCFIFIKFKSSNKLYTSYITSLRKNVLLKLFLV